ncbi:MAG: hypothetical protein CMI54_00210 [Parcubacteria group bacterium]|nr:hypothetical protein [Parcubacteria group bacterium]|tara:strand:- start:17775 stop:18353 length:579 start_codon:yes stop_codon:yes gene_type:complete
MATLRPFRDYDEKDVINLYALDVSALNAAHDLSTWDKRVGSGTLVKLGTNGWRNTDELDMIGGAGDFAVSNVTSQRYGVAAKVAIATATDTPLGMLLHHVAKYDENGEQLKFNPRKASELESAIEGQAVPLVTRGLFLVNGIDVSVTALSAAGQALYAGDLGQITCEAASNVKIGQALGLAADGNVLIKLEL